MTETKVAAAEVDRYVAILEEAADNWAAALAVEPVSLTARICRTATAHTYGRGNAA